MTEKEKMLAGLNYDSRDPELLSLYRTCKSTLKQFSDNHSVNDQDSMGALRQLFDSCGTDTWIEAPFYCDYGIHIRIGNHVFIHTNAIFLDSNLITIGHHTLIGPGVHIYTAFHPLNARERIYTLEEKKGYITSSQPVTIGDHCWIGGGTLILPGVTIGRNTTIGAGSIVTKDIPENVLALGNPCRVMRSIE